MTRPDEQGVKNVFIHYVKNCVYGGNFSHLLHKKLKVWWKKIPKKLSEHAHLLGSSEYLRRYANACNYANSWIYVMYICKRF